MLWLISLLRIEIFVMHILVLTFLFVLRIMNYNIFNFSVITSHKIFCHCNKFTFNKWWNFLNRINFSLHIVSIHISYIHKICIINTSFSNVSVSPNLFKIRTSLEIVWCYKFKVRTYIVSNLFFIYSLNKFRTNHKIRIIIFFT